MDNTAAKRERELALFTKELYARYTPRSIPLQPRYTYTMMLFPSSLITRIVDIILDAGSYKSYVSFTTTCKDYYKTLYAPFYLNHRSLLLTLRLIPPLPSFKSFVFTLPGDGKDYKEEDAVFAAVCDKEFALQRNTIIYCRYGTYPERYCHQKEKGTTLEEGCDDNRGAQTLLETATPHSYKQQTKKSHIRPNEIIILGTLFLMMCVLFAIEIYKFMQDNPVRRYSHF